MELGKVQHSMIDGGGLVTHGKTARGASSPCRRISKRSPTISVRFNYQQLFEGREKGQISAQIDTRKDLQPALHMPEPLSITCSDEL